MLCTILTVGLILIFFDVTLIQLIILLIVIVTVLPFLLGMMTVTEVRTYLANLKNTGVLKRLNDIKLFEKKATPGATKPAAKPEKTDKRSTKPETSKPAVKTGGIKAHFASIAASFKSLGTILKERGKHGKKVEEINKMLDKTVSEKVPKPTATPTPTAGTASAAVPAGGGGTADASDPFLSLSGDEFDEGLLDGLDDDPSLGSLSDDLNTGSVPAPDAAAPELQMPSLDEAGEAPPTETSSAAPAPSDGGLDAFSGLEGSSTELDAEFGDLDSISLDDVEIDEDLAGGMETGTGEVAETPSPEPAPAPAAPAADPNVVKTAWIPSDAPTSEVQEDQIGVQSDMASFAGGATGSDEDLLSSIASDVKTVKKEKDLSLLRELKDFKAPAIEIESELTDMFQKMGGVGKDKKNSSPSSDGIK